MFAPMRLQYPSRWGRLAMSSYTELWPDALTTNYYLEIHGKYMASIRQVEKLFQIIYIASYSKFNYFFIPCYFLVEK